MGHTLMGGYIVVPRRLLHKSFRIFLDTLVYGG